MLHSTAIPADPSSRMAPDAFRDCDGSIATATLPPSALGRRKSAPNPNDPVLESLICETQHAASRCAVITGWVNALESPERAAHALTVQALLPHDPTIIVTMQRWIASTGLNADTLYCTQDFFVSLAGARKAFELFVKESKKIGPVRSAILHRSVLRDTWRILSVRAINTLDAQHLEVRRYLTPIYQDNAIAIRELLSDAIGGGTPCQKPDGTIALPNLPQQRATMRKRLLENCLVTTDRKSFVAFARDVSAGGIGLDRVPHLAPGTLVTLKLPAGRTLDARVSWYKNASAGVQFLKPLPHDDPLLAG